MHAFYKNATENVDTKALNMRHQQKKVFRRIFVGVPQHQKCYLSYVTSTQKIISSHDVVFDETFYSPLTYTSRPYSEALTIRQEVSYIPCAT